MTNLQLLAHQEAVPTYPVVRSVRPADLQDALIKGFKDFLPLLDFLADPFTGALFSIVYTAICICLVAEDLPLVFPLVSGFALIGPFVAMCFYEVSRRRELGLDTSWTHVFGLWRSPSLPSILLLGFALLALLVCWLTAAEWLYVRLFGPAVPESLNAFVVEILLLRGGC